MNWRAIDLNLLIVFDAVMQDRNVTRASRRIGLSQPAVSHALARLRHMLRDDLFIRTPRGMLPTPRAEQLAEPLRRALSEMRLALEPAEFDPATAQRRFVLATSNYCAIVLGPSLVAGAAAAPGVVLDVRPRGTLDIAEQLDRGNVDLAIGNFEHPGERFATHTLIEDSFVLAMRRGHPALRRRLSARAFAELPHLEVSSSDEDVGFVDHWLDERGLTRRIALRVPYLSAAEILAQSDMVAVLSGRVARQCARVQPIEIRPLPFDPPRLRTSMLWHRRLDRQPAHRWLRAIAAAASEELCVQPSPA